MYFFFNILCATTTSSDADQANISDTSSDDKGEQHKFGNFQFLLFGAHSRQTSSASYTHGHGHRHTGMPYNEHSIWTSIVLLRINDEICTNFTQLCSPQRIQHCVLLLFFLHIHSVHRVLANHVLYLPCTGII